MSVQYDPMTPNSRVPLMRNFTLLKNNKEYLFNKIKKVVTGEAIKLLTNEWRNRVPDYLGVKKEILWPEVAGHSVEKLGYVKEKLKVELDKPPLDNLRKQQKHVHNTYTPATMWEGFGLKKFKGSYLPVHTKRGPVAPEAFEDGELENVDSVHQKIMKKQAAYFVGVDTSDVSRIQSARENPADSHMTMAFLGNKSPEALERIKQYLAGIANSNTAFNANSSFYAKFGPRYPHAGVERSVPLNSLYNQIVNKLQAPVVAGRSFMPHITLAEPSMESNITLPDTTDNITVPVRALTLYETNPGMEGNYKKLETYELKAPSLFQKILTVLRGY